MPIYLRGSSLKGGMANLIETFNFEDKLEWMWQHRLESLPFI